MDERGLDRNEALVVPVDGQVRPAGDPAGTGEVVRNHAAAIYLRVSTDEQTTDNQERELREAAEAKGLDVVHVYRDNGTYPVKLTVFCDDRYGMLKQITAVISDTKTNIRNIEARTSNGQANVDIVLDIADLKHLENIVNGVRKIPGVHDVQRLQKI